MVALNVDYLRSYVQDFRVKAAIFNKVGDFGKYFIAVALIIADAAKADNRVLPAIVIPYFRDGNVKFAFYPPDDGPDHHTLALEVHIFREAQADRPNADVYRHQNPLQANAVILTMLEQMVLHKSNIRREECQTGGW
jgi:hypothetical protein